MHKTSDWLQSFYSNQENFKSSHKAQKISDFHYCNKICITGGKGGVGKTSIALKAAQELARSGYRTLLIDCDSNLSNTSIKLGFPLSNQFEKLLSAEATFEECVIQQGNFHLLPACNGSIEVFESKLNFDDIVLDIISAHEHEYDYILLDCPAGVSRETLTLAAQCDYRWVVVVPEKSSITDSYSLMKLLASKFDIHSNHIVVNMYQTENQFSKVVHTLTKTVGQYLKGQLEVFGGIPKVEISADSFDTFFLSENKSEAHKNFVKLLYEFTEREGGPLAAPIRGRRLMELEQDVQ